MNVPVFRTFKNMKPIFVASLALALVSISLEAKIPSSAWKSGVLKRTTKDHLVKESGQLGKKPPKHGIYISYYYIESENSLYEGDDVSLKNNEKGFPITVDAPVKFFVNANDLYIRDDKGKEHKLRLVNVLPTGASTPQQSSAHQQQ